VHDPSYYATHESPKTVYLHFLGLGIL